MPSVEMIYAQAGWFHSICALIKPGMIIRMPDVAGEIQEREYRNQEFLYEAWERKRDTSGLRTYNGITVTSLREYLSTPMRKKPKPKGILAKILDSLA
jgi:hypothetical protein